MAVVNAIVAHPNANSYVTAEEINAFMGAVDLSWITVTSSEAARFAIMTAAKINAVRFLGQPYFPNQGMAFPRKNDARVRSIPVTGLSSVALGDAVEECTPEIVPAGTMFYTENFPIGSPSNTVTCTIAGLTVVLNDSGTGILTGVGVAGTINYDTGHVTLDAPVDAGTTVFVAAKWYANNKLFSADLVFDAAAYLPGHLNGGSVHVPHADGTRDYCAIRDHNIVTGIVTLGTRMGSLSTAGTMLFPPYARVLKDAQLTQLQAERGLLDWDRNASRGISTIKIGDTSRSYSNSGIPEKAKVLAGKYRVHEIVIALLGPYTIYGKLGVMFGEWDASSAAAT